MADVQERVTILVPLSRPEMIDRVKNNIGRQQGVALTDVVVVENGRAVGAWKSPVETVLRCDTPHPAAVKNVGLTHVRQATGGLVAIFDDDDHYGPEYLLTQTQALREHPEADIVGKKLHYVARGDGLWLCRAFERHARAGWLMGGTQVFDVGRVTRDYPLVRPGEDTEFCRGLSCWATGWSHYCNRREHGGHCSSDPVERTRKLGHQLTRVARYFDAALIDGGGESDPDFVARALTRLGAPWPRTRASSSER